MHSLTRTLILTCSLLMTLAIQAADLQIISRQPVLCYVNYIRQGTEVSKEFTVKGLSADEPHLVKLSAPGYDTQFHQVRIVEGTRNALNVTMRRSAVPLLITASRPSRIYNGDEYIGETPYTSITFPADIHTLTFTAEGYLDTQIALDLNDGKPRHEVINLISDSGTIRFDSRPRGATVKVNGETKGLTPCEIEHIHEGEVSIALSLTGHYPVTQNIRIVAGQVLSLTDIRLKEKEASLTIKSLVPQCRIYINGENRGLTDQTFAKLPAGSYQIRVEKAGYLPMRREISLSPEETKTEEFRLVGNMGILSLQTSPAHVHVVLDGEKIGTTRPGETENISIAEPYSIAAGNHELRLSAPGHKDEIRRITIQKDTTLALQIALERIYQHDFYIITKTRGRITGLFHKKTDLGYTLELRPGVIRTITFAETVEAGKIDLTTTDTTSDDNEPEDNTPINNSPPTPLND